MELTRDSDDDGGFFGLQARASLEPVSVTEDFLSQGDSFPHNLFLLVQKITMDIELSWSPDLSLSS